MISASVIFAAILGIVIIVGVFVWMKMSADKVDLTKTKPGQKPEWMRSTPQPETIAATEADGEPVAVYDYDKGEKLAAPFAEQIEDILAAQMAEHPELKNIKIDFGTARDGSLEIHIDGAKYSNVNDIPDQQVREAIQKAIATYTERQ